MTWNHESNKFFLHEVNFLSMYFIIQQKQKLEDTANMFPELTIFLTLFSLYKNSTPPGDMETVSSLTSYLENSVNGLFHLLLLAYDSIW